MAKPAIKIVWYAGPGPLLFDIHYPCLCRRDITYSKILYQLALKGMYQVHSFASRPSKIVREKASASHAICPVDSEAYWWLPLY